MQPPCWSWAPVCHSLSMARFLCLSTSPHLHHTNTHRLGVIPNTTRVNFSVLHITLKWLYLWADCFELLGFGMISWAWVSLLNFHLVLLGFGFWGFYWGQGGKSALCLFSLKRVLPAGNILYYFYLQDFTSRSYNPQL